MKRAAIASIRIVIADFCVCLRNTAVVEYEKSQNEKNVAK